ncbi:MAG: hypothetical protein PW788_06680 [Micavibrio sp.]|nr:hypothetical protein [Micavibrio sp.]
MEDLKALDHVIQLMTSSPPFSPEKLLELRNQDKARQEQAFQKMLGEGVNYGVATGMHEFLNKPENEFRAFLKSTDNDLNMHVGIITADFNLYLQRGEVPAPYYAWRIAVILRKMKFGDKEHSFLAGWCNHFARLETVGGRYRDLVIRTRKLGIEI